MYNFKKIVTINGVIASTDDIFRFLQDLIAGKTQVIFYNGFNVITE